LDGLIVQEARYGDNKIMLDKAHEIDWEQFGYPEMAMWLNSLVSSDENEQRDAYLNIKYTDIHEYPDLALAVFPYFIEILSTENEADKTLLVMAMITWYATAKLWKSDLEKKGDSQSKLILSLNNLIKVIEREKSVYKNLLQDPEDEETIRVVNEMIQQISK
jgi:hypothetical protein